MLTSTSGAVLGSSSCPRTLRHADQGSQTSNLQITRCWLYPWATSVLTHQRCLEFSNHGHGGGVVMGVDCTVVTSQPDGSPDRSFEGAVSEYRLCTFFFLLRVLIGSQYLYRTPTCLIIKAYMKTTLSTIWDLFLMDVIDKSNITDRGNCGTLIFLQPFDRS